MHYLPLMLHGMLLLLHRTLSALRLLSTAAHAAVQF